MGKTYGTLVAMDTHDPPVSAPLELRLHERMGHVTCCVGAGIRTLVFKIVQQAPLTAEPSPQPLNSLLNT